MRSRYSAFALGLGSYLVRTLAADHPDQSLDELVLTRTLSSARQRQRFLGLTILSAHEKDGLGEVTFRARIFERGVNRSFTERSTFVRESGGWRYAAGELLEGAAEALL